MNARIVFVAALVALAGCSLEISEREVFQPNPYNRRPAGNTLEIDYQEALPPGVQLQHARVASAAGAIATTVAETDSNRLIVLCGGNAADRKSSGVAYLQGLVEFGDVLLFDYPGYGDSAGTATAANVELAIDAIAQTARARNPDELIIWGQSLGGFVCAAMAARMLHAVDSIVFETSARNAQAVAATWTPWYLKPFLRMTVSEGLDAWDNVEALTAFDGRVLVLGAGRDRVLPVSLSRGLADDLAAAGLDTEYVEFEDAGHNNVPRQPGFRDAIRTALLEKP